MGPSPLPGLTDQREGACYGTEESDQSSDPGSVSHATGAPCYSPVHGRDPALTSI